MESHTAKPSQVGDSDRACSPPSRACGGWPAAIDVNSRIFHHACSQLTGSFIIAEMSQIDLRIYLHGESEVIVCSSIQSYCVAKHSFYLIIAHELAVL